MAVRPCLDGFKAHIRYSPLRRASVHLGFCRDEPQYHRANPIAPRTSYSEL